MADRYRDHLHKATFLLRWSQPTPCRPVASDYVDLTVTVIDQDGKLSLQGRFEQDSLVLRDEAIGAVLLGQIEAHLAAKAKFSADCPVMLMEAFEVTRLPGQYGAEGADLRTTPLAEFGDEHQQAAIRLQSIARGRLARRQVALQRLEREEAARKITALARGRRDRRRVAELRQQLEAEMDSHMREVSQDQLVARRVEGLRAKNSTAHVLSSAALSANQEIVVDNATPERVARAIGATTGDGELIDDPEARAEALAAATAAAGPALGSREATPNEDGLAEEAAAKPEAVAAGGSNESRRDSLSMAPAVSGSQLIQEQQYNDVEVALAGGADVLGRTLEESEARKRERSAIRIQAAARGRMARRRVNDLQRQRGVFG